jgi:peroxiredoxin
MNRIIIAFIIFFKINSLLAQSAFQPQIDAPNVGDACPNFKFYTLTHNRYLQEDSIAAHKGKVIILEFWATTCRPCIPAMDNFEILEASFPNQVKVFSVSDEDRERIERFLDKHPTGSTILWDYDKKLNTAFYHHFIPHTVLIDPQGIVRAFTSPEEVTPSVIRRLLSGQDIAVKPKHEYDPNARPVNSDLAKALDAAALNNDPERIRIYPSQPRAANGLLVTFSGYRDGVETQINWETKNHVSFVNCPATLIYQSVLDIPNSRMVLEISADRLAQYSFTKENAYCLELSVPDFLQKSLKEFGQQQLEILFPLKAKQESKIREVICLKQANSEMLSTLKADTLSRKGTIKDLLTYLENLPSSNGVPVINETGLPDDTLLFFEWFTNNPASVDEKLKALNLKKVSSQANINCWVLYEPNVPVDIPITNAGK